MSDAEGIGPFERLVLDFSERSGHARPGPHILAGVNGSGKSTVLRAIAWALEQDETGFDNTGWEHLTRGHSESRVFVVMRDQHQASKPYALARGSPIRDWAHAESQPFGLSRAFDVNGKVHLEPGSALPDMNSRAWNLGGKRAIARDRNRSTEHYSRSLSRFEAALRLLYGEDVRFDVDIEPHLQPLLRMRNQAGSSAETPMLCGDPLDTSLAEWRPESAAVPTRHARARAPRPSGRFKPVVFS